VNTERGKALLKNGFLAYTIGKDILGYLKDYKEKSDKKRKWSIAISEQDTAYSLVMQWLLDAMSEQEIRNLTVQTNRHGDRPGKLAYLTTGINRLNERILVLEGYPISIQLEHGKTTVEDGYLEKTYDTITFSSMSRAAIDAVLAKINSIARTGAKERLYPSLKMKSTWGGWTSRESFPQRPMESVVLRAGQKEAIIKDVSDFLDQEELYFKRAIPWHRGYLFHGPPGTGKSSLAHALSTHFNMNLYYIPLSDVSKDSDLLGLLQNIDDRSIVLFEDIDVFSAATEREQNGNSLTMSGLLNALDGIGTPSGIITIMTTNHVEKIDPAIMRPGRIDQAIEVGYVDSDQASRLFQAFYDCSEQFTVTNNVAPAEVMEIMKRNFHEPEIAAEELRKIL